MTVHLGFHLITVELPSMSCIDGHVFQREDHCSSAGQSARFPLAEAARKTGKGPSWLGRDAGMASEPFDLPRSLTALVNLLSTHPTLHMQLLPHLAHDLN
jgi:hypothetical protein